MYEVKPRQLTEQTIVFDVYNDGLYCATFGKNTSALNFASYMNVHNINTLVQWRKQPIDVIRQFIFATNCTVPNFKEL